MQLYVSWRQIIEVSFRVVTHQIITIERDSIVCRVDEIIGLSIRESRSSFFRMTEHVVAAAHQKGYYR
jgi:hypothetical protein